MAASAYHVISKEVENRIFWHNCNFRNTWMYKQPMDILLDVLFNKLKSSMSFRSKNFAFLHYP